MLSMYDESMAAANLDAMLAIFVWSQVFVDKYSYCADGSDLLQREHHNLGCALFLGLNQPELPAKRT